MVKPKEWVTSTNILTPEVFGYIASKSSRLLSFMKISWFLAPTGQSAKFHEWFRYGMSAHSPSPGSKLSLVVLLLTYSYKYETITFPSIVHGIW